MPYDNFTLKNTSNKGILNENWNDILEDNKKQKALKEEERKVNKEKNCPKKIFMIDLITHNIIKEFNSIAEAGKYLGVKPAHIPEVCKGKRKSAYGYFWKYA